jgi:hypothetical protein
MARTSSTRSTAGTGEARGRRPATIRISDKDRSALALACDRLEHPSLAARLTALIGRPVEEGLKLLPRRWYGRIHDSAEATISRALSVAIRTLPENDRTAREDLHKLLCIGSGAVGGFFGLPGTLAELPLTTTLMMRSIADIARDEGEDLALVEGRMACVEVFAYGGRPAEDDAAETGYYGLRLAMAFHFSLVSAQLVEHGIAQRTLPATVALTRAIAGRFGVAVSDKIAFQLVPMIGAIGGAAVNAIFVHHFQEMARGHFTVRRLERKYGQNRVQQAYEKIRREGIEVRRSRPRVLSTAA